MNYGEFTNQLDRLKKTFGEKYYPDERVRLFWKRFAFVDALSFEHAVDFLLMTCKTAPLLEDFGEAMDGVKNKYVDRGTRCDKCENSGWSDLWRDPKEIVIAERCSCCGGPEALARFIERHPTAPDRDLADKIRKTFSEEGRKSLTLIKRPTPVNTDKNEQY